MQKSELSDADRERIRKCVQVKIELETALRSLVPSITEDEVDSVSHDLADLWDLGQRNNSNVRKILEMNSEKYRFDLEEILSDLLYGDIVELEYHIASLRQTLPTVLERISSQE